MTKDRKIDKKFLKTTNWADEKKSKDIKYNELRKDQNTLHHTHVMYTVIFEQDRVAESDVFCSYSDFFKSESHYVT